MSTDTYSVNEQETYNFCLYAYTTPGRLSQVPPAEALIIGCDRYPELPVTVKNYTIKDEYLSAG